MNYGLKILPITMCENVKTCSKAWEKWALALYKNMFLRHRSSWINRFCHQIVSRSSSTWWGFL